MYMYVGLKKIGFVFLCACALNVTAMEKNETENVVFSDESAEDTLWGVLKETELTTELTPEMLNQYTDILTKIYKEAPEAFDTMRKGYTPQEYAMYCCHYQIGTVIDHLLKPTTSYKPTDPYAKEKCINWAEINAQALAGSLLSLIKKPLKETEGIYTFPLKQAKFALMIETYNNYSIKRFECRLIKKKTRFDKKVGSINFIHETNRYITVGLLSVLQHYRQKGFGRFLLLTLIEAAKLLKSEKTSILLYAAPDDYKMLPILMNYYKSLGFQPHKIGDEHLKLTIKNGSITYPWEKKIKTIEGIENQNCITSKI